MSEIYELYQNGKLMFVGDRAYLAKKTKLSEHTIYCYCRPGWFDDKKNETNIKIVKVGEVE